MGDRAEVLLVGSWRLVPPALALTLALVGRAAAGTVRAEDYDAFWLWAGVRPQPVLANARTLYILQGQVAAVSNPDAEGRLIAQGGAIPHLRSGEVWLDYRAHTLRWSPEVYGEILARLGRGGAPGQPVARGQIDIDAPPPRQGA